MGDWTDMISLLRRKMGISTGKGAGYGRREARRLRSEEHTSEFQSLMRISYAVFCLKKNKESQNSYNDSAEHTFKTIANTRLRITSLIYNAINPATANDHTT